MDKLENWIDNFNRKCTIIGLKVICTIALIIEIIFHFAFVGVEPSGNLWG